MYSSSITIDTIMDKLVIFLTPFLSGVSIVRAQVNRTSMPPNPCVVLTELLQVDIHIPWRDYQPPILVSTSTIHAPARIDVQMDFYGALAGEYAKTIKSVFRSDYAFDTFPSDIKPLYTSDAIQAPLITGEQQYESRWTITTSLQYNPTITLPQQFADEAKITGFVDVDV